MASASTIDREAEQACPEPELDPEMTAATKAETGLSLFSNLPSEVRCLIWESTLPPSRVFHVSGITESPVHHRMVAKETAPHGTFTFHINHAAPTALSVCRESRNLALRRGFFLSPGRHHAGTWFNPNSDVLYFDRNQRHSLRTRDGSPTMYVQGWENVRLVGLEWRAFFRDIPRLSPGEDMRRYWRAAITPLYAYMPHMTTLYYILPMVRHKGGVTWGREPYGSSKFEADLHPLPGETHIPWETMRNMQNATMSMMANDFVNRIGGRSALITTWSSIKSDMDKCFEDSPDGREDAVEELSQLKENEYVDYDDWDDIVEKCFSPNKDSQKQRNSPPRIEGSWLLRPGQPDAFPNPQVQTFRA